MGRIWQTNSLYHGKRAAGLDSGVDPSAAKPNVGVAEPHCAKERGGEVGAMRARPSTNAKLAAWAGLCRNGGSSGCKKSSAGRGTSTQDMPAGDKHVPRREADLNSVNIPTAAQSTSNDALSAQARLWGGRGEPGWCEAATTDARPSLHKPERGACEPTQARDRKAISAPKSA